MIHSALRCESILLLKTKLILMDCALFEKASFQSPVNGYKGIEYQMLRK